VTARSVRYLVAGLLLILLPLPGQAQESQRLRKTKDAKKEGLPLKTVETEDLRLVYFGGIQDYIVPHVVGCFENSMEFQRELWGYTPSEQVTVFIADFSDRGNASAASVPRNFLYLQTSPLGFDYEALSANERMNWLMNHELVHISAVDNGARSDSSSRKFFAGKVAPVEENPESILYFYLTAPRDAAPRWYHEGIAVFVETWMARGRGRAQGVFDEMVFRSMVLDDSHFYDPLGLVSKGTKVDFQVEINSYLYGTRFMSYLVKIYGPEKLVQWIARSEDSKKYFAAQFKRVYGMKIEEAWANWIAWEAEFQQNSIDIIREYPLTPHTDLSSRALGSVSRAYYDPETTKIYAGFNYPGVVAHVGAINVDDGSVEKIIDIKGPVIYHVTSLAYDPETKTLFYTTDNLEHRDIRAVNAVTGEDRTLLKDIRIGNLAFNRADRSLWGVRHFNGLATLARVPAPWEDWEQIHTWPYGDIMYGLDVSPDGKLLSASVGELTGRHSLRVWEIESLLEGDMTPVAALDFGHSIPSDFVFSPDGRYLYGSTYYTGVSNIVRFDWAADEHEFVSNTDTGLFRPVPLEDGRVGVFRFTGEGFVPAVIDPVPLEDINAIPLLGHQIIEEYPELKEWDVGSPSEIDLDEKITGRGSYRGFKTIGLESIYPIVQGYRDTWALGFRINFSDPMQLNRIDFSASYSPDSDLPSEERPHLNFRFRRYNWWVNVAHNYADFYDLFGPTLRSRKGQRYAAGWDKVLVYDKPRKMELNLIGAFFDNIDELPRYQDVPSPVDQLASFTVRLGFENVRGSLGRVDDEKGHGWEILNVNKLIEGDYIPSLVGNYDVGFDVPLRHSSVWVRSSAGFSVGELDDQLSNFFFGGFQNNYVDHLSIKRYRSSYTFPGVEINELFGRTYGRLMIEWNLPPFRFERAGTPGFYIPWMRASLFASGIALNPEQENVWRREVANVGTQVDFKFSVLSRLPMTLSLGYAAAFESGFDTRHEGMISLNILH
jgi:hypothetical protein